MKGRKEKGVEKGAKVKERKGKERGGREGEGKGRGEEIGNEGKGMEERKETMG